MNMNMTKTNNPFSSLKLYLIEFELTVSNIELVHDRDPKSGQWHRWYNVSLEPTGPDQDLGLQNVTVTMSEELFERYKSVHFVDMYIRHTYQNN